MLIDKEDTNECLGRILIALRSLGDEAVLCGFTFPSFLASSVARTPVCMIPTDALAADYKALAAAEN